MNQEHSEDASVEVLNKILPLHENTINTNNQPNVEKSKCWVYCFVRADLPRAQQTVQALHAVMELARNSATPFAQQTPEHPYVVLLEAPDEAFLVSKQHDLRAQQMGIVWHGFKEPDRQDELTALCALVHCSKKRRYFRHERLFPSNQE